MRLDAEIAAPGMAGARAARDAVGWFAAHELRTPLQAIQGGVALLLEDRGAGLSATQLEALGLINAATADLERCITHLCELAALSASSPAAPQVVPLVELLAASGTAVRLRPSAALEPAATTAVHVVPSLVRRALVQLSALAPAGGTRGLDCEVGAIAADWIGLDFRLAPSASGDGALAWQLASALIERAGATLATTTARSVRLTLRRATGVTISP